MKYIWVVIDSGTCDYEVFNSVQVFKNKANAFKTFDDLREAIINDVEIENIYNENEDKDKDENDYKYISSLYESENYIQYNIFEHGDYFKYNTTVECYKIKLK